MAKPSLMNLHILILTLLNGHKISRPQQQLDTEDLSQSETFCEEYSKFLKLWLLNLLSHLKLQLNKTLIFQCQFQKMKEKSYDLGDLHVYHFYVPNISENCKLTISSRNFPMQRFHHPFP